RPSSGAGSSRAARDELGIEQSVAEPFVEREHRGEAELRRGAQGLEAVCLGVGDLGALDRAGDSAATRLAAKRHEAVRRRVAVDLEVAVAKDGLSVERNEVGVRGVRV